MTDAVADKSELDSSGASLNYHSWLQGEVDNNRTTSPLLHKDSSSRRIQRSTPEYAPVRGGTQTSGPQSIGTTYKHLLDSQGSQEPFVTKTPFGEIRNCKRLGWVEWLFTIIATVSMAGTLGISVERFVFLHKTFGNMTPDFNTSYWMKLSSELDNSQDVMADMDYCGSWTCLNDFIFAVLILVNLAFSVYYCYDGLLRERPFEMLGFAVTVFVITSYIIVNYFMEGEQEDVFKLVRLVLVCLLGPQNIVLALVVQYRMGFLVLNTIGTNKILIRAYRIRSFFLTVQTFNIQVLINVLVLTWARMGRFTSLGEKVVLPVLLVYMIITSYVGWIAVMWEKKKMALSWILLVVISLGYYIFKMVNVGVHWEYYKQVFTDFYVKGEPTSHTHFLYVAIVILIGCCLGLLSCIAMTLLMLASVTNFDVGLKERLPPPCCVTTNYIPGLSEP